MSLEQLPDNLPVPQDDGACDHLIGMHLPAVSLPSTKGGEVDLADLGGCVVIYCYPMTGQPGVALPEGWDEIPGARGCTPQSCAFRDHYEDLSALGASVFGLSVQDTPYQAEMAERLHLPFAVLSDAEHRFAHALRLPQFKAAGMDLIKRVTIIAHDSVITHIHYPVFPSHDDADWVIAQLKSR